ncbi:hypothetical protein ECANGB1_224 [Enterospora canceri]|uniref:guanosine-diphosphatase n=1 Tax=Enterospora canceri TaxID=1081671 RepID=A0A1Y1S858_9MICR|nr:hypothetical protein ECANGB1_224 [Enterospora canceri]
MLFPLVACLDLNTVAIIDAGSTGTRLNLYSFDKSKIELCKQYKHPKAISEEAYEEVLSSLTTKLDEKIPLGFYGTAGMRQDSNGKDLLKKIKTFLKKYNLVDCRILTGPEEAIGLYDAFEHLKYLNDYTLVDMGGNSTQVVVKNHNHITIKQFETGIQSKKSINLPKLSKPKHVNNLYVFSAFADLLKQYKSKTIRDVQSNIEAECNVKEESNSAKCKDYAFILNIISQLNISTDSNIKVLDDLNEMYVSWPIGMALKIQDKRRSTN